jgi:hypothetical protein
MKLDTLTDSSVIMGLKIGSGQIKSLFEGDNIGLDTGVTWKSI